MVKSRNLGSPVKLLIAAHALEILRAPWIPSRGFCFLHSSSGAFPKSMPMFKIDQDDAAPVLFLRAKALTTLRLRGALE
jgi:hypothetical protein